MRRTQRTSEQIKQRSVFRPLRTRTADLCVWEIDPPCCAVRCPLNACDQRIRAAFPVDDTLREIVLRILEYRERVADRCGDELGGCLPDRRGVIDGATAAFEDPQLFVLDEAIASNGPRHSQHHLGARRHPLFVDGLTVARRALPASAHPGELTDDACPLLRGGRLRESREGERSSEKSRARMHRCSVDWVRRAIATSFPARSS